MWKPCVLVRKCDFLFVFTCNCRCNIAIFSTVIAIRETALFGHINNIATLSANIKLICKKIELYWPVSPVPVNFIFTKSPKQLPNCLEIAEAMVHLIVFNGVLLKSSLILLPVLTVDLNDSGTRNVIYYSVTVYSTNISSQYNFTAQTEPVQDKKKF